MKIIIHLTFIMVTIILLTGCGGGGGGGATPNPTNPYLPPVPVAPTVTSLIGTQEAYNQGYTGAGSTIAVLDSGTSDTVGLYNRLTNTRSFAAYDYNTSTQLLTAVSGGIDTHQVESVITPSATSGKVFSSVPTVTFSGGNCTVAPTATAVLNANGTLSAIYMTKNGSGCTSTPTATLTGGGQPDFSTTVSMGGMDTLGHGTNVMNIAAGRENNTTASYGVVVSSGVAYNANVMNLKVIDSIDNTATDNSIANATDYAVAHGANIINMSLGGTGVDGQVLVNSLQNAVNNGLAIVVAAGNDGLACKPVNGNLSQQCSFPAALPWVNGNSALLSGTSATSVSGAQTAVSTPIGGNGAWIVVGSVDQYGNLSSFSNKAGVMMWNYVVAPGENLTLTNSTTGTVSTGNAGTSYAAPIVSGMVALMHQKYPSLTMGQIGNIIFTTATDLGATGVDDVYGWGEVNATKAFAPIGGLSVATSGASVAQATGSIKAQSVIANTKMIGNATIKVQSLTFSNSVDNTIGFDSYGRDYKLNVSSTIGSTSNQAFDFNSLAVMNVDNILLGVNPQTQQIAIGYRYNGYETLVSADHTLFGLSDGGLLSTTNENTYYGQIQKKFDLSDTIKEGLGLDVAINGGIATASGSNDGLVSGVSTVCALGGKVGVTYDSFEAGYKRPMSVISGNMALTIPTSRNLDGTVNYQQFNQSLANVSAEQDYFVSFGKRTKTLSLNAELMEAINYAGNKGFNQLLAQIQATYWF